MNEFVRPQSDTKLDQLSAALSKISPEVAQFAGAVANNIDSNAETEGRLSAEKLKQEGLSLGEATRKGIIKASSNPFYLAGLREQLGRNMADQYDGDLRAALAGDTSVLQKIGAPELAQEADTLKGSTKLSDYDTFAQKFRSKWQEASISPDDADKHFNTGFQFRADAYENRARADFAGGIESKATSQADDATFAEVYKHVSDSVGKLPPAQVATEINSLTDDLVKQGRNPTKTLQAAAKAVATAAVNSNSLDGVEVLKGLAGKFGPSPYAVELYSSTRSAVEQGLWTKNQHEQEAARQADAKHTSSVLSAATAALVKDPRTDLTQYIGQLGNDPHAAEQLESLRKNVNGLKFSTDEAAHRALFAGIWSSNSQTTNTTVIRALNSGKLSVADANGLMEQIAKRGRANDEGDPLKDALKDFTFQHQLEDLKSRFADKTGVFSGDAADRAAHAQAMLIDRWTDLSQSAPFPKMTVHDKVKWLTETSDAITRYERAGTTFGPDTPQAAPRARFDSQDVPAPLEDRLPKRQVLLPADLNAFAKGIITDNFRAQAIQAGITPDEQAEFVRDQISFIKRAKPQK